MLTHIRTLTFYKWTGYWKSLYDVSYTIDFDVHFFGWNCNVASRTLCYPKPETFAISFFIIYRNVQVGDYRPS
jgi:hypothetical protein